MILKSFLRENLILKLIHRRNASENSSAQAVKLAYNDFQTNVQNVESVIVMHGLFGSKSNWSTVGKALSVKTGRRVVCVDVRNHGESPHTSDHSYVHIAEDIKSLMKELNLKKTSLIGHSMGGKGVMYFALKYPNLVEKLIVVDISPVNKFPSPNSMELYFSAMENTKFPSNVSLPQCRVIVDKQLSQFIKEKTLRAFFLSNIVEMKGKFFSWRMNLEALKKNYSIITSFPDVNGLKFEGPTLFIGGEKSNYIPVDDRKGILKLFPNAEIRYIEGAGHWVHSDKPVVFLEKCIKFLGS